MNFLRKHLILLLILSGYSSAQNWFPLEVGNKWQFLTQEYENRVGERIKMSTISVLKDTIINDHEYYQLSDHPQDWVRYSAGTGKIYIYWNDSDYVHMDFNMNNNDTLNQITFYPNQLQKTNIEFATHNIFDVPSGLRGFKYYPSGSETGRIFFTENIGYCRGTGFALWLGGVQTTNDLIQAIIINDSTTTYYSYNMQPVIIHTPVSSVSDSVLDLQFNVDHSYNLFRNFPFSYLSFNFIDSAYVESFYQKDDLIIQIPQVPAINTLYTDEYKSQINLNIELLKQGYVYFYKIIAKDKGIIPGSGFSPDTNYYQIIYSPETKVERETENNFRYFLFQNYPNPFNPATNIQFVLPKSGKVMLAVYDILGNQIKTLVNEYMNAGSHHVSFDASGLASGIYFYRLMVNDFASTKQMVLFQ